MSKLVIITQMNPEAIHKRRRTIWFHLYKILGGKCLIYSNKERISGFLRLTRVGGRRTRELCKVIEMIYILIGETITWICMSVILQKMIHLKYFIICKLTSMKFIKIFLFQLAWNRRKEIAWACFYVHLQFELEFTFWLSVNSFSFLFKFS